MEAGEKGSNRTKNKLDTMSKELLSVVMNIHIYANSTIRAPRYTNKERRHKRIDFTRRKYERNKLVIKKSRRECRIEEQNRRDRTKNMAKIDKP